MKKLVKIKFRKSADCVIIDKYIKDNNILNPIIIGILNEINNMFSGSADFSTCPRVAYLCFQRTNKMFLNIKEPSRSAQFIDIAGIKSKVFDTINIAQIAKDKWEPEDRPGNYMYIRLKSLAELTDDVKEVLKKSYESIL